MFWIDCKWIRNIHEWVYKLISFLDDELKDKIKYLPQQFRETAYFITMARIKQFVSTVLVATESDQHQIKKWNIISIYNFNLDIIRLETYSRQTLVPGLCEMFVGLKQLLDLLLSGKNITEYLDEDIKMEKYPMVETRTVRCLLEKYKPLGFLNKLPKHIPNLDKKTVQNMVRSLREME